MSASTIAVSVVIPCFNEEGTLRDLYEQIRAQFVALGLTAEIIFIDDGSTDQSRPMLREMAARDPLCRVILFRRNCGKAAALQVGFAAAQGEVVMTMDADLQDDPQEIPRFLEALREFDVVSGWKATRHDPIGKTLPSKLFNATVRKVTGVKLHDMNCGFKGYRRAVVREVTLYGELHRFIPALAAARGFTVGELAVTHHPRRSGVSKYGWERIIRGFLDLLTVVYLTKYRFRPGHLFGTWGIVSLLGSGVFAVLWGIIGMIGARANSGGIAMLALGSLGLASALLVLGATFLGLGLIAEAVLVSTFRQAPTPPISESLNLSPSDEVAHAG
jgi:glycosyltransferase involved in cell wall biosynthesis